MQILSNVFGESVDKNNLKSVIERQCELNISFDTSRINTINNNIIGCIQFVPEQSNTISDQDPPKNPHPQPSKNQAKIERLRSLGLTNEEIAEMLEIPLDTV